MTLGLNEQLCRPYRPEKIPLTNVCLGLRAVRFTPGYNITDFQSAGFRAEGPTFDSPGWSEQRERRPG